MVTIRLYVTIEKDTYTKYTKPQVQSPIHMGVIALYIWHKNGWILGLLPKLPWVSHHRDFEPSPAPKKQRVPDNLGILWLERNRTWGNWLGCWWDSHPSRSIQFRCYCPILGPTDRHNNSDIDDFAAGCRWCRHPNLAPGPICIPISFNAISD